MSSPKSIITVIEIDKGHLTVLPNWLRKLLVSKSLIKKYLARNPEREKIERLQAWHFHGTRIAKPDPVEQLSCSKFRIKSKPDSPKGSLPTRRKRQKTLLLIFR